MKNSNNFVKVLVAGAFFFVIGIYPSNNISATCWIQPIENDAKNIGWCHSAPEGGDSECFWTMQTGTMRCDPTHPGNNT